MPMSLIEAREFTDRALRALRAEFGEGAVRAGNGRVGEALSINFEITPGGAEKREAIDAAQWSRFATLLHPTLTAKDFGGEFLYKNECFTIVGCSPNKPKYSIKGRRISDGKIYQFPAAQVARALGRSVSPLDSIVFA